MKIRVFTLNIHKGRSWFNRRPILEDLKNSLKGEGIDLLFLQEVLGAHADHAPRPQFEQLADSIWSHYAYGRNAIYSKGHHGNAILSQFPIVEFENINLSNHRWEQRGLLHACIQLPGEDLTRLHGLTVHLDLSSLGRRRQLGRIIDRVRRQIPPGEPLILAGDFNDWSGEASKILKDELGLIEAHEALWGSSALTYPAAFPVLRLDRIYFRGLQLEGARCLTGEPWSTLSDHLGLAADLEF